MRSDGCRRRISKCDATIADFRLQEDYNEKKLADAKEHLETTDKRIRELRANIREHSEASAHLEQELADVCGRERELARELSELREGRDALLAQISLKETEKADLQHKIDRTDQALETLDYQRLELEVPSRRAQSRGGRDRRRAA